MTTPADPASTGADGPSPEASAPVLPIAELRPVLDRLASLAVSHPDDVARVPGLAEGEDEVAADPPAALEQLVDELGGITVRGREVLTLLVEDRTDTGPYTLLGEASTFYPLLEGDDAAVILTLDDDGAAGAVYGIGEDLALRLAAPDLGGYLALLVEALEVAIAQVDALDLGDADGDGDASARDDALEAALEELLFAALLGTGEAPDGEEGAVVELVPDVGAGGSAPVGVELPSGTVAAADLRGVQPPVTVDIIDADLPGDPLGRHLAWRAGGLVVALVEG